MTSSSSHEQKWRWRALAGLSAAAAGTGTLAAPLWALTPLGLGLFFFLIWKKAPEWKEAAVYGGAFGLVTAGTGLLSLLEIVPGSPAESEFSTLLAASLLWLVPSVALGLASVPSALLLYIVRKNLFAPFAAVLAWILNDELRAWSWTLITYGPGAIVEPHLSISALGYAFADSHYLLQLARAGGLLSLTGALALLAAAFAFLPDMRSASRALRYRAWGAFLCALVVLCLPAFMAPPAPEGPGVLHVAVFSTNVGVPGGTQADNLAARVLAPSPDVVVLPEGKTLADVFGGVAEEVGFSTLWLRGSSDTLIIHSALTTAPDGTRHNTVFFDSKRSGPIAEQNKQFLMPEGEYLPVLSRIFLGWIPGSSFTNVSAENTLTHGSELVSVPFGGTVFGALLCSEVFSSRLYHKLAKDEGARVLVNLADPEWFRGSHILFTKTIQVAKVHAVENQAYFLAADNAEPSFIIDPLGRVVAETAWGATDVLLFDLPVPAH